MDLTALLSAALGGADAQVEHDATALRILDATAAEAATRGMHGVTADAVARRAGVGRVTIYRRFGGRDELLAAMVLREGEGIAAAIAAALGEDSDPGAAFADGFVAAIRTAREHPIIARLAQLEPERLLAAGIANDGTLLKLGRRFVAQAVRELQTAGIALHVNADEAGETLARLFAAFVLIPTNDVIDFSTDESTRAYVTRTLGPMVTGAAATD